MNTEAQDSEIAFLLMDSEAQDSGSCETRNNQQNNHKIINGIKNFFIKLSK